MIVTMEETSISIGMKQPIIRNSIGKTKGNNHLALEIQEIIKVTIAKLRLHVL